MVKTVIYSLFFLLFLSGCASGFQAALNAVTGAVGSILVKKHEDSVSDKATEKSQKNQKELKEIPKRKLPRFDY